MSANIVKPFISLQKVVRAGNVVVMEEEPAHSKHSRWNNNQDGREQRSVHNNRTSFFAGRDNEWWDRFQQACKAGRIAQWWTSRKQKTQRERVRSTESLSKAVVSVLLHKHFKEKIVWWRCVIASAYRHFFPSTRQLEGAAGAEKVQRLHNTKNRLFCCCATLNIFSKWFNHVRFPPPFSSSVKCLNYYLISFFFCFYDDSFKPSFLASRLCNTPAKTKNMRHPNTHAPNHPIHQQPKNPITQAPTYQRTQPLNEKQINIHIHLVLSAVRCLLI